MTYTLLDGKAVAEKMLLVAQKRVAEFAVPPKLTVVMVGENPASATYVRAKEAACTKVGLLSEVIRLPESISQEELQEQIAALNADPSVTGMIVQLPLPQHLYVPEIIRAIDPKKDVDGFHAYNLGKMFLAPEFEDLPPATPSGIIRLLEAYKIDVKGLNVVVIGHSNIVGKPISTMLLNRNATVTTCHVYTQDLAAFTRQADLIVVAVGKPHILTGDMVKEDVIVIDVGTNRLPNGKLSGDVDFETVAPKCRFITPVPGGVGPMTVATLIANTIHAKEREVSGSA